MLCHGLGICAQRCPRAGIPPTSPVLHISTPSTVTKRLRSPRSHCRCISLHPGASAEPGCSSCCCVSPPALPTLHLTGDLLLIKSVRGKRSQESSKEAISASAELSLFVPGFMCQNETKQREEKPFVTRTHAQKQLQPVHGTAACSGSAQTPADDLG